MDSAHTAGKTSMADRHPVSIGPCRKRNRRDTPFDLAWAPDSPMYRQSQVVIPLVMSVYWSATVQRHLSSLMPILQQ
jgi:hypothetical protein